MSGVWYPSAKIRITPRIEDFGSKAPVPSVAIPAVPQEGFGPLPFRLKNGDIIPYNIRLELNSYRTADTVKVTFPFRALPFDPRILRAASLQVFGGVIPPELFVEDMGTLGTARALSIISDFDNLLQPTELFRGFVDDWEMDLNDSEEIVTITSRDLTSVFLDAEMLESPLRDIPSTLPLDQVIRLVISGDGIPDKKLSRRFGLPAARGTLVVNDTGRAVLPSLADIHPPSWFDSKKMSKRARASGAKKKISYWDFITDLCVSAGFICRLQSDFGPGVEKGASILIQQPNTYYKDPPNPTLAGDLTRVFTYGDNIDNLRIRRNLTGYNAPTVEVRSHDVRTGVTRAGRFPKTDTANAAAPSGIGDREEVKIFTIKGMSGPNVEEFLENSARSLYEQLGRNEFEVNFSGTALSAVNALPSRALNGEWNSAVADMFLLRPSDPVRVEIAIPDKEIGRIANSLELQALSRDERVQEFVGLGFDPVTALEAANALESESLQRTFRVRNIQWSWSFSSTRGGWSWEINAMNYLVVRAEAEDVGI